MSSEATWTQRAAHWFQRVARKTAARDFYHLAFTRRPCFVDAAYIRESLSQFPRVPDAPGVAEEPIFILSTGWRSGSTLLQRILDTDPRLLVWGEPFGEFAIVPNAVDVVSRMPRTYSIQRFYIRDDFDPTSLATSWMPCLYPPAEDFVLALRSFFDRLLAEPARQRGFHRWGLKEVRLSAADAILLSWLYPNAKFLILSRHPYGCYRSWADAGWHPYTQYPGICVDSVASFARHWDRLATSWSELPNDFPAWHMKYEDLIDGKVDFRKLEAWLGLELKEEIALDVLAGHTAASERLRWYESWIIRREANRGMKSLGYSG